MPFVGTLLRFIEARGFCTYKIVYIHRDIGGVLQCFRYGSAVVGKGAASKALFPTQKELPFAIAQNHCLRDLCHLPANVEAIQGDHIGSDDEWERKLPGASAERPCLQVRAGPAFPFTPSDPRPL